MNLSTKQKIRFLVRWSISVASYGLAITFLFHNHELFLSLTAVFVFFIAFHFFYLELYKFKWRYLIITLILWITITWIIMTPQTTTMRIANIGFHIMIWLLVNNLYRQTEWSVWFDSFNYFSVGWYLFTMALALVYSTVVVNFFSQFPMNCEELNEKSDKAITTIAKPFKISREKTQDLTKSSKTFFSSTFGDLFEASQAIEIKTPTKDKTIISKIKDRKDTLITQTILENKRLNNTICDYTLNLINKKLQSPTIQYPAIILILFLIYPFLRIIVRVLSFVGLALFKLWYLTKLYTKHKEMKEVERIR